MNLEPSLELEPDDLCLEKYRRIKLLLDVNKSIRRCHKFKSKDGWPPLL